MEESGFICEAHSSPANVYCLCKGTKQYLCNECYVKHMQTATSRKHIILSVFSAGESFEDMEKLNKKSEAKEAMRSVLKNLTERVEIERKWMMEYLTKYQEYHIAEVYRAYSSLSQHCNGMYDLYSQTFQHIHDDLSTEDSVPSPPTSLFIDFVVHLPDSSFLRIENFVTSTIKLSIESLPPFPDSPLQHLLETWGKPTKCSCETCEEYRSLFDLPLQTPWTCYNCRKSNKGTKECSECHCGREWADYLTCKDVQLSNDRKKWICPHCTFKNGLHDGVCAVCDKPCIPVQQGLSMLPSLVRRLLYPSS